MNEKLLTFENGNFTLHEGNRKKKLSFAEAVKTNVKTSPSAQKILNRIEVKKYLLNPNRFVNATAPVVGLLDPHQVEGIQWILTRSRSYLAHAPGAGKTLQTLVAAAASGGTGKVVFIVPVTALANWAREIAKWIEIWETWPEVAVLPESTRQVEMNWDADILLIPHSMLRKAWVLDALTQVKLRFLAVDEASAFKECESQCTIALFGGRLKDGRVSPGLVQNARHSVLLDGSPAPNGRAMELWAPTYAMAPQAIDFMSREKFGFRYCEPRQTKLGHWEFRGSSHVEELRQMLQSEFMHVVSEDMLRHPERRRTITYMTSDVRSGEMKKWEQKNLGKYQFEGALDEELSQGDLAAYRRELGLRKVPWIATYVADRLSRKPESLLLFAWHREVVLDLARRLKRFNPGVVLGGVQERDREKAFSDFQSGRKNLLILNIAAGGRIHNLTKADRILFGEFSWSDETNKQAEKRASRKGSEKAFVRCEYIASPGSLDERVLNTLFNKIKNTKKLIG